MKLWKISALACLTLMLTPLWAVAAPPIPAPSVGASSRPVSLQTEVITYRQGDQVLEGFLAYNPEQKGPRPGVLVVHEWVGINDYIRQRVQQLAAMGYVAFAPDIYGKGIRPAPPQASAREAAKYRQDRALARARMQAGLEVLQAQPQVDTGKLAAIGYCFGGTMVLEQARSGAPLQGFVSFHGGLDSPTRDEGKNIQGKVLIIHGADDPLVPEADLQAFQQEMRAGGVDWTLLSYGGAVHAFTNPESGNDASRRAAYHPLADARSFGALRQFLQEIFSEGIQ